MSDLINGPHGLLSTECACGKPKAPKMSFCQKCYYTLSPGLRTAIYRRIGEGYEDAHARAMLRLKESGRVT